MGPSATSSRPPWGPTPAPSGLLLCEIQVKECASPHLFALCEGFLLDQSDCCAQGRKHYAPPVE